MGQRSGLAQSRRLGGRLGSGVPVRTCTVVVVVVRETTAARAARHPAVRAPDQQLFHAVRQARVRGHDSDREQHVPRHDQKHTRVSEVLQESSQIVRRPVRRHR